MHSCMIYYVQECNKYDEGGIHLEKLQESGNAQAYSEDKRKSLSRKRSYEEESLRGRH
nr:MAG TPA: hypothetical protein [Caudoviricetes sp.]